MIGFVIACHLATAPKMAQKNRGPYSGTSVSLAFLMPSAVAEGIKKARETEVPE